MSICDKNYHLEVSMKFYSILFVLFSFSLNAANSQLEYTEEDADYNSFKHNKNRVNEQKLLTPEDLKLFTGYSTRLKICQNDLKKKLVKLSKIQILFFNDVSKFLAEKENQKSVTSFDFKSIQMKLEACEDELLEVNSTLINDSTRKAIKEKVPVEPNRNDSPIKPNFKR